MVLNPNVVSGIVISSGGSEVQGVDFAETDWAKVRGVVFSDSYGPLGNVSVQLVCNDGELIRTTVTDNAGVYVFEEVTPGDAGLMKQLPQGFGWTGFPRNRQW